MGRKPTWREVADDAWFASGSDAWLVETIRPQAGSDSPAALSDTCIELDESEWPDRDEGWSNGPVMRSAVKGTFFDQAIDLHDPVGHMFTSEVLLRVSRIEKRKNKRSAAEDSRHYTATRKLLANAVRCSFYRTQGRVAYFAKAEGYSRQHDWLNGPALSRSVKLLEMAGLVTRTVGFGGRIYQSGCASTYEATEELLTIAHSCGIGPESVMMRLSRDRLVRLKSGGDETHFEPNAQTEEWADRLLVWNDFVSAQQIELSLSSDEQELWTGELNSYEGRRGLSYRRPELFQRDLYKSFVDNFEQHGRMYGGWWITAPKELRKKIKINNHPTVELDFRSCSMGMLYNYCGLVAPDDSYELPKVTAYEKEAGLKPEHFRETLKAVGNALINGGPKCRPDKMIESHGLPIPPVFSPRDIVTMLEEKHQPISSLLRANMGLQLHRCDSDLALEIICSLSEAGIVALPVHDSFITPERNGDDLRRTMKDCYEATFGFVPSIRCE